MLHFLVGHMQSFRLDGLSNLLPITPNVVQGSELGPVLFIIFIVQLLCTFCDDNHLQARFDGFFVSRRDVMLPLPPNTKSNTNKT